MNIFIRYQIFQLMAILFLALISERISVDFLGTNSKEVKIFDETFRFILKDEGIVDACDIQKKYLSLPNLADMSQISKTTLGLI